MKEALRTEDMAAFMINPSMTRDLTIDGKYVEMTDESNDGSPTKVFVGLRIVSDMRERPVDEIEVHYPFAAFPPRTDEREKESADEGEADERLPDLLGPDTEIGRRQLPGKRKIYVPSLRNKFTTSMPAWKKTKLVR